MLHSTRADIYFSWEKLTSFKSEEDKYLSALQVMTTADSEYQLIPKSVAEEVKSAKDATESANTAVSIAKEYETQQYVSVAGEQVSSKLVRDALTNYADTIKRIDTEKIGYATSLVSLLLSISERQVYKQEKVEKLKSIQSYAASSDEVSLPEGFDAAITELENQNQGSNAQTAEAVEQWAKDNAIDLASVTAKTAGTKFGSWLVSKSSYAASVSSWATSSTAGALLSGAASTAGTAIVGWQIGGILTGRGGTYQALVKAEYSHSISNALGEVQENITKAYGTRFSANGATPRAEIGTIYADATYLNRLALVKFHQYDATALERNIIGEYEKFVENVLGGQAYATEKRADLEHRADREEVFATKARTISIDEINDLYTDGPLKTAPQVPSLISPKDDTTGVQLDTSLNWETSSDADVTYNVYVERGDSTPDTRVTSQKSGTYNPSLKSGSRYYWQIVAVDSNGRQSKSKIASFRTIGDAELNAPSDPTPASSASGIATSVTLSWNTGGSKSDAESYQVYIGTSDTPSKYVNTEDTSVTLTGLQNGQKYYWKVVAKDGTKTSASPTWTFQTRSGDTTLNIKEFSFQNEARDGPLKIQGGAHSDLETGYLEYMIQTTNDGGDYDLRVVNERGILIGVEEDTAYDGESFASYLDLEGGSLFRRPGTHSADVIVHAHDSGDTYRTTTTTEVGVEHDSNDFTVLPTNPQVNEEVSVEISHISEDTCDSGIEGYEWSIIKNPDRNADLIKEVSGTDKTQVSFTPSESAEYRIAASDTNGCIIDADKINIEDSPVEPSLSIDDFSAPSTVTSGEKFTAEVNMSNSGDAQGNYLIRFKVDQTITETETHHVDAGESGDVDSAEFSLPAGIYDVSAVVFDSHNNKHVFTQTVNVIENSDPNVPTITAPADESTEVGLSPTLEWSASDPNDDGLTYSVRFEKGNSSPDDQIGAGRNSNALSPGQLEYNTTYYWQVIATDEHGATSASPVWKFTTASEPNKPPRPNFTESTITAGVGEYVQLNATTSTDPDGTISTYKWDLDEDGQFELKDGAATAITSYQNIGTTNVTVQVTDENGASATATLSITIVDRTDPVAEINIDLPVSTGDNITFDANGSSDNDQITRYDWDFDDDSNYEISTQVPKVSQKFVNTGKKNVSLRVSDASGNTGTDSIQLFINRTEELQTTFNLTTYTPDVGEAIEFDASGSISSDGTIITYEWDFDGDGTTDATGKTTTHTFDSAGEYDVELTVTDGDGTTNTTTRTVTVSDPADDRPRPALTTNQTTVQAGAAIAFDASDSTDPDGSITTYEWDFDGDGSYEVSGQSPTIVHTFEQAGTERVRLRVTGEDGETNSTTTTVTVATSTNEPPEPVLKANRMTLESGGAVSFDASDSTDSDGSITTYEWDFDGDGITDATGSTIDHTFDTSGEYDVELTVTDDDGSTNTTTRTVTVLSPSRDPAAVEVSFGPTASVTTSDDAGAVRATRLTATLVDADGYRITEEGVEVSFGRVSGSGATLDATSATTNASGVATVWVNATETTGQSEFIAQVPAYGFLGRATLTTTGPPARLNVTAATAQAAVGSLVELTVTLHDEAGRQVPYSDDVSLTTDVGRFDESTLTLSPGTGLFRTDTTLTASEPGMAEVTAIAANAGLADEASVEFGTAPTLQVRSPEVTPGTVPAGTTVRQEVAFTVENVSTDGGIDSLAVGFPEGVTIENVTAGSISVTDESGSTVPVIGEPSVSEESGRNRLAVRVSPAESSEPATLRFDGDVAVAYPAEPADNATVEVAVTDSAYGTSATTAAIRSTSGGQSTYDAQNGVATHDGFAYVVDDGTVKKVDMATDETVNSFEAPDGRRRGLAYGDGSLWFADGVEPDYDGEILELDPETGAVRSQIDTSYDPRGLAFTEGSLWAVDVTANDIVEYSPDGTELDRSDVYGSTGDTGGRGLAYHDGSLWYGTNGGRLYEFSTNGSFLQEVDDRDTIYGGLATNETALLGPDENGRLSVLRRFGGRPVEEPVVGVDRSTVRPGENVTFRVNSSTTGELSIEGDLANWTVTETSPATRTTYPNPSQTPYDSQSGDTWGHIFPAVDSHSFEVTATAPGATGTYDFTAMAKADGSSATSSVTVEVAENTTHESGVSQALFGAVAGGDGTLDRSDVISAVGAYLGDGSVDGAPISREDVLDLVRYYLVN